MKVARKTKQMYCGWSACDGMSSSCIQGAGRASTVFSVFKAAWGGCLTPSAISRGEPAKVSLSNHQAFL